MKCPKCGSKKIGQYCFGSAKTPFFKCLDCKHQFKEEIKNDGN
jgi:DNA-directed RNA polymerase subunit RPC12/RpoP